MSRGTVELPPAASDRPDRRSHSVGGTREGTSSFGLLARWLGDGTGQTRLERRLQENGGRITAGGWTQVLLFVWRSATQLERSSYAIVRDLFITGMAGLVLGFLFEGTMEKVRCEHILSPYLANYTTTFTAVCKRQYALGERSWFERIPFFCYSDFPPPFNAAVGSEAYQFHGIVLGYRQALSLLILASAIISIQTSLNTFGAERTVFWRESRHYSIFAYLLGKNIAQLPLTCLYPFCYCLFVYQLLRPYAPFQTFYLVFLLMQWVGEGLGQLISLCLNTSRQLAGGVAGLLCTVVTGSFPLLNGMGPVFNIVSYFSFCRWGMIALLSVEFAPWHSGDPALTASPHPGCCALPPNFPVLKLLNGSAQLPRTCNHGTGSLPTSSQAAVDMMNVSYGYTAWLEPLLGLPYTHPPGSPVHQPPPDFYPLNGSKLYRTPDKDLPSDPGFSLSACTALVLIGLVLRILVYLALRFMDRTQRR